MVGASGGLLRTEHGDEIDGHDAVFRFSLHRASPAGCRAVTTVL